jgi:hypothetical protein
MGGKSNIEKILLHMAISGNSENYLKLMPDDIKKDIQKRRDLMARSIYEISDSSALVLEKVIYLMLINFNSLTITAQKNKDSGNLILELKHYGGVKIQELIDSLNVITRKINEDRNARNS